jgi:hypothetical protein
MFGLFKQAFLFVLKSKKYWMLPLLLTLVSIAALIVAGEGSVLMPFIYALW